MHDHKTRKIAFNEKNMIIDFTFDIYQAHNYQTKKTNRFAHNLC